MNNDADNTTTEHRWLEVPSLNVDLSSTAPDGLPGVPDEAVEKSTILLNAILAEIPATVRPLADLARLRTHNRFHEEARSIARRSGTTWRAVMLASMSYDLVMALTGCSTIALATPSGPVLARNMDWWPEALLARASYLLYISRHGKPLLTSAGWPGAIGVVTGLSPRGFGIALNAVRAPRAPDVAGYPVLLHIRRVLEDARNFDEAVRWLSGQRLTVGCILTVVGTENHQRLVIERTPRKAVFRPPHAGKPLLATNHYRRLFPPKSPADAMNPTVCSRYDALAALFHDNDATAEVSDLQLLYALTDPAVKQEITAQHVIIRPRINTVRLFVPRHLVREQPPAPAVP